MNRYFGEAETDGLVLGGRKDFEETVDFLPVHCIHPNPNQPRKLFDQTKIEELAQSMRTSGVLQPILVKKHGSGYMIISGERRYHAAKLAGLEKIPAILKNFNDRETLVAALVENLQREDLNSLEEAQAIREILLTYNLTHDQLAMALGRSRSSLTNLLRILKLPEDVQGLIVNKRISAGHAKMLAGLETPAEVKKWVKKILNDKLSVYETEKQLALEKFSRNRKEGKKLSMMTADVNVRMVEERLTEAIGAKVRIRQGKIKGVLEIEFYNREDLERVVESLLPQGL